MLTDEKRTVLEAWFTDEVQGGVCEDVMQLMDRLIEDEILTQDEFKLNETEICNLVDASWFTCNTCGWTMPISEQDERGEWDCHQCMDEEHD